MGTTAQDAWVRRTLGVQVGAAASGAGASAADAPAPGAPASGAPASGAPVAGGPGNPFRAIKRFFSKPPAPAPVPRTEIGAAQSARADGLLQAMSAEDRKQVQDLLDGADDKKKKYLQKALSANHGAADLQAFHDEIADKDDAWMEENLHLVGGPKGRGIKQQWECSCVPTTVQAMRGEIDPIFALQMRKANPKLAEADNKDATKLNPAMAAEQKALLEHGSGVATARNKTGKGMQMMDAFGRFTVRDWLGMTFESKDVAPDTLDGALTDIDTALADGLPVPIVVGQAGADNSHAVLVTGGDGGPPRRYSIHDPWAGKTVTVDEDQIRQKKLNIAGWPELIEILKPKVTAVPTAQSNAGSSGNSQAKAT